MMHSRRLAVRLVPAALLLLTGCGGGRGDITGVVTYKGEPLPLGRITFLGETGQQEAVSGYIIRGKYTIQGCPAGPVKVGIESLEPPNPEVLKGTRTLPISAAGGMKAPELPPEFKELASGPPLKYVPIPLKYANPETSELTYEVKKGAQTQEFVVYP